MVSVVALHAFALAIAIPKTALLCSSMLALGCRVNRFRWSGEVFTLKPADCWLRGGLFHYTRLNGQYIMGHSSTVQILKITNETRMSKANTPYDVREAEVLLLNDEGAIDCAGSLRLSKALLEGLVLGTYRAGFSMVRQAFGDRRGDIVSQLVSLQLVPVKGVITPPVSKAAAGV